jgi:hypothetical protein
MYGTPVREQGAVDLRGRICMQQPHLKELHSLYSAPNVIWMIK